MTAPNMSMVLNEREREYIVQHFGGSKSAAIHKALEIMMSHNPNSYEVTVKDCLAEIDGQTDLDSWTIITDDGDEMIISVINYHMSGISFTCRDWQGPQPRTVDEIQDYNWVSFDGEDAIILVGLPVLVG